MAYQYGFSTALQGGLQIIGSNCSSGVSGFSFNGVYRAPMGTTRREASCDKVRKSAYCIGRISMYHAGTWKDVPTQADAISVLIVAPLLLHCLKVHNCDRGWCIAELGGLRGTIDVSVICVSGWRW